MDASQAERAVGNIRRWLLDSGRFVDGTVEFDSAFVERLRAQELPVVRYTTGVPSLHPQVDSFSTLWELGKETTVRQYRLTPDTDTSYQNSPLFVAYREGRNVRCGLETPPVEGEYGILADLRLAGLTDYYVLALPFSDGSNKASTFATDRTGGFDKNEIKVFDAVRADLATVMEVRYLRHLASTLMDTYVGPVAGKRVLSGRIKRGDGETIRAAIWFSDLRGFTSLSELLPGSRLIDLLNDYFGAMTEAVAAEGGEILKFIGDAMLAIFMPSGDGADAERAAAKRALAAAAAAGPAIEAINQSREAAKQPVIRYGIALHFGDVNYGNVGGADRLDFTVIGPAVNLASRIEGLTGDLGRAVLVSAAFAALHGGKFDNLGEHALKGVGEKRAVYAPAGA